MPSRSRTAASIGSTPEGWPRRMSPAAFPEHSLTSVPSRRAATETHRGREREGTVAGPHGDDPREDVDPLALVAGAVERREAGGRGDHRDLRKGGAAGDAHACGGFDAERFQPGCEQAVG